MTEETLRDESGIRIRIGRDPKMVMEAGEGEAATAAVPAESVPEAASTGEPVPTEAATSTDADPFDDPANEKFDRSYVEKLRTEAAEKRVELKRFKETFEGWDEQSVDGMLNLAKAIAAGDTNAAPVLETLLKELTPAQQAAVENAVEQQETAEAVKYMTPEEVEAFIEKRDQEKEEARKAEEANSTALAELETKITDLGYDLKNPNPRAALLFHFAQSQAGDGPKDFEAAHKEVEKVFQSEIDAYVERVAGRGKRFARGASATGDTPAGIGGEKPKLSLRDGSSRKAMEALLDTLE